ncbi:MAG: hypothetical protein C0631_14900 [Sedimenticola sp.]|nr:MAG: hypothetical protein C0631_14900 [Sedimenticola sp.]
MQVTRALSWMWTVMEIWTKQGCHSPFIKRPGFPGAFLSCLILVLWFCGSAIAGTLSEPQRVIQSLSDQMQQALRDRHSELQREPESIFRLVEQILVPRVDFSRLSNLALGKHWREATDEQRQAFAQAFQSMLVRTYATAFHEFKMWEMRFLPLRSAVEDQQDIEVRTQVVRPGAQPVDVIYRMHNTGLGWMAYDVSIEGISLATNYRSSFSKMIRQHGMDGLIRRISELNQQRLKPNQEPEKS